MPFPSSPSEWKKSQPRRIIKSDTVETMAEDSAGRGRAWCAKRYKRNSKECAHCFVGWLSQGRSRKNPKMLGKTRNARAFKKKIFSTMPLLLPHRPHHVAIELFTSRLPSPKLGKSSRDTSEQSPFPHGARDVKRESTKWISLGIHFATRGEI